MIFRKKCKVVLLSTPPILKIQCTAPQLAGFRRELFQHIKVQKYSRVWLKWFWGKFANSCWLDADYGNWLPFYILNGQTTLTFIFLFLDAVVCSILSPSSPICICIMGLSHEIQSESFIHCDRSTWTFARSGEESLLPTENSKCCEKSENIIFLCCFVASCTLSTYSFEIELCASHAKLRLSTHWISRKKDWGHYYRVMQLSQQQSWNFGFEDANDNRVEIKITITSYNGSGCHANYLWPVVSQQQN